MIILSLFVNPPLSSFFSSYFGVFESELEAKPTEPCRKTLGLVNTSYTALLMAVAGSTLSIVGNSPYTKTESK
jgi:hypothetical protein